MISFENIRHSYSGVSDAVSDVSFRCLSGTLTGIIGPNGSGKTTLIKCAAGLIKPQGGKIFIDGRRLEEIPVKERAKLAAYIPQQSQFPFPFTALEIVLMGRSVYQSRFGFEDNRDVLLAIDAMKETGADKFAGRAIQELSGGEQQRTILARAIVQNPKIMLLDEPTAALDIGHSTGFYDLLIKKCRRENLTVLSSMHDLNTAALFCDRIILLKEGRVVKSGETGDVLDEKTLSEVFDVDLRVTKDAVGRPCIVTALRN